MTSYNRQHGGSAIGLVIFLAILAYGIFVGIQYVPQYIESTTVDSILNNIAERNKTEPLGDITAIESAIDNQLYINQMTDLKDSFSVMPSKGDYVITVKYERALNLLYENKVITYEQSVTLKK